MIRIAATRQLLTTLLAITPAIAAFADDDAALREMLRQRLESCLATPATSLSLVELAATSAFASRLLTRPAFAGPASTLARNCWQAAVSASGRLDGAATFATEVEFAELLADAVEREGTPDERTALKLRLDRVQAGMPSAAHQLGIGVSAEDSYRALAILVRGSYVLAEPAYLGCARAAAAVLGLTEGGETSAQAPPVAGPAELIIPAHAAGAIAAELALYQATGESAWLVRAIAFQDRLDRESWDAQARRYHGDDGTAVAMRFRCLAAVNMLELATITADDPWQERADALLDTPLASTLGTVDNLLWLGALDQRLGPLAHLMIVGDPQAEDTRALIRTAHAAHLPRLVIVTYAGDAAQAELRRRFPAMVPSPRIGGQATGYLCVGMVCNRATSDPATLERQLAELRGH